MPQPSTVPHDRTVFFVSDGTGITAETLGHSVLTQFEHLRYRPQRLPFIDSADKAREAAARINDAGARDGKRPIVFSTLVDPAVSGALREGTEAFFLEMFETFVEPLERELDLHSTHTIGRSHAIRVNSEDYKNRIEAINFTLAHDDGQSAKGLAGADVILVGVSRSGKTPTSLYLAMQYGVKAANYPLIPEDFERGQLPSALPQYKDKIYGLSISPERLAEVRHERRPNSRYAALENCRSEIEAAERMMKREGIRWLSSTTKSIEEIAATIMQEVRLERRSY
ncbi:MAG TPA: pyruvate, water dikinase regulatory protein [Burkholderiaceae bacterium]|jgi:regulator of PEP synthase PpsR (kinase-PPPase family)|nr:pyruvate, water dikinase regulatory protein [Burkholderiaceae bacterium]